MAHCLVTGGAGFVGINLIQRLLKEEGLRIRATLYRREPVLLDSRVQYVTAAAVLAGSQKIPRDHGLRELPADSVLQPSAIV